MPTQEQIIAANLRREKNEWSLDNSQISEEGLKANALFKYKKLKKELMFMI